jgi:hypothetical protein
MKVQTHPRQKKARQAKSKVKSVLTIFLWHQGDCSERIRTGWPNHQFCILLWCLMATAWKCAKTSPRTFAIKEPAAASFWPDGSTSPRNYLWLLALSYVSTLQPSGAANFCAGLHTCKAGMDAEQYNSKGRKNEHNLSVAWNFVHWLPIYASTIHLPLHGVTVTF